jgi:hypothetical protein
MLKNTGIGDVLREENAKKRQTLGNGKVHGGIMGTGKPVRAGVSSGPPAHSWQVYPEPPHRREIPSPWIPRPQHPLLAS